MKTERPTQLTDQAIDPLSYDRLWRAQHAAALLACITSQVANETGITHNSTAAIAEFISEDMRSVLNRTTPVEDLI